ncbi:MAG: hypothetical protein UH685_06055 [Bacteroidaceae bacterium]|nr:hypothetical protein [Bacteroidaceae bacterium]
MKKITFVAAIMLLSSCKTRTVVMTVPEVRIDTVMITKWQRDSIWLHDSIHVSEKTKGDTVWLEVSKWHTKYVEKVVRDTTYVATHDTIPMPYPVEVIKEVEKDLNWLERSQMYTGKFVMWLLIAGAALLIFKIAR